MLRKAFVPFATAAILASALLLAPETARAGGCTECTTSAECVAIFGEPAYCVRFSSTTGCGDLLQYCCPGQGCAASETGPSCAEDGRCVVVDGPGADGGMTNTDGGPTGTDGGPTGTDGGGTPRDGGGTPPRDGGGTTGDGGTITPVRDDGGCCSVAVGAPRPRAAALALALVVLGAAGARRRSRRAK